MDIIYSIHTDYLQDALVSWKWPIWDNRLLLPEAERADRGKSVQLSFESGSVVLLNTVTRRTTADFSSEKAHASQPLRPCANPAKMAQLALQELTSTSLLSLQLYYFVFRFFFSTVKLNRPLHWCQSAVQVCVCMDMLSTDCSHAEKSNTTGRRQWRNAVRCPLVADRAQLNVSDDMTLARKNAHSSSTVLSDTVMPLGWSLALQ